jgi:hypothetical protein
VSLSVWDIGGQSIGSKMISNYIFGAQALVLVYDITNYQSFQNLEEWFQLVQRSIDPAATPYIAVVGNKSESARGARARQARDPLPVDRTRACPVCSGPAAPARSDRTQAHTGGSLCASRCRRHGVRWAGLCWGAQFAGTGNMHSYFVSAKSGENVKAMFYNMAAALAGVKLTKEDLEGTTVHAAASAAQPGSDRRDARGL